MKHVSNRLVQTGSERRPNSRSADLKSRERPWLQTCFVSDALLLPPLPVYTDTPPQHPHRWTFCVQVLMCVMLAVLAGRMDSLWVHGWRHPEPPTRPPGYWGGSAAQLCSASPHSSCHPGERDRQKDGNHNLHLQLQLHHSSFIDLIYV